jgi:carbon storage regulator CsrA
LLVLSRGVNETITITVRGDALVSPAEEIEIKIVEIRNNKVRVGITAEKETFKIMRGELFSNKDGFEVTEEEADKEEGKEELPKPQKELSGDDCG